MNKRTVFTKTAKGLMEATGKTSLLSRELRSLLAQIDGKASVGKIGSADEKLSENEVTAALQKLLDQGFIRELIAGPSTTMGAASQLVLPEADLDFSAIGDIQPAATPGAPPRAAAPASPPPRPATAATPEPALNFPSVSALPGVIQPVPQGIQSAVKAELRAEADAMAQELAAALAEAQAEEQGGAAKKEEPKKEEPKEEIRAEAPSPVRPAVTPAEPAATPARREADDHDHDRIRKQIEDEIRRSEEAEAKVARDRTRREVEARLRKEIDEKARAEAEAKVRLEGEKKAREDYEAKAGRDAEDRVRKEVDEKIKRQADDARRREEGAHLRAEMEKRQQAAVQRRAAEPAPAAAVPQTRKRMPVRRGRLSFGFFVLVVAVGLGVLQFLPLNADRYSQLASERFQMPVTIESARFSLLPIPSVQFENVTIGRVPVANVKAVPEIDTLFDERPAFKSIEFSGMTMSPESLAAVMWAKPGNRGMTLWEIRVRDFRLMLPGTPLPKLQLTAMINRDGSPREIRLASADRKLTARIVPEQSGRAAIEINADALTAFGLPFALSDFSARATATRRELVVNEFDARLLGGVIKGNGRLHWSDGWNYDGEVELRTGDAAQIAPEAFVSGRVGGRAALALHAQDPGKLFAATRIEGTFNVDNGVLGNIDLPRMVQTGLFATGTTQFTEFSGQAAIEPGRVTLRQVRLVAAPMTATLNVDIDSARNLNGRLAAEVKVGSNSASGQFNVGGTLARPQLTR